MILSKLDNEEECDATFKKALTYNTGNFLNGKFVCILMLIIKDKTISLVLI